ncbi:methyltransferase domain-containing protein [Paenibacillaceae bacterium]|nr:methyltransferase domain-containing protein [Paenibacillaceae bacterium]
MNGVFFLRANRRERSAELFSQQVHLLQCPYCNSAMTVHLSASIICQNNHTFDLSRQGYLNVLTRPFKGNYDKSLFAARQRMITLEGLYAPLVEQIRTIIYEHMAVMTGPKVLDAGCGEGSLLHQIVRDTPMTGFGIDIAKEGIAAAAAQYTDQLWIVGDLSCSPYQAKVFDVILNLFSPSNYGEFNRLLTEDG